MAKPMFGNRLLDLVEVGAVGLAVWLLVRPAPESAEYVIIETRIGSTVYNRCRVRRSEYERAYPMYRGLSCTTSYGTFGIDTNALKQAFDHYGP